MENEEIKKEEKVMITYDEFKKVEMRVGEIVSVEIVEGADKLYKFMVDLGEEKPRQILSAIREYYAEPNFFMGKKLVFVSNLEPRVIRGLESQGMVVAVDGIQNQPIFLVPETDVPNGSKAR
ncbi:MAG: methionyl-tRNA synthetase [Patescibacteria group bacterium]|jgi:methionine--tRNA ligase beta chain|nr:methionyl-tRNA synthetase [Patescibacteria group bacterium]